VYRHLADGRGGWKRVTKGHMKQVQVYQNNLIFGLGTDKAVWKWIGAKWTKVTTGNKIKFIMDRGTFYGLGEDHAIWSTKGGSWNRVTSAWVSDFTISENRRFLGVGRDKAVYRHLMNGQGSWEKITATGVTQVKVFEKKIFGLGTDKAVYRWADNKWIRITTGSVTKFDVSRRGIFGLDTNGAIVRASGLTSWARFTNGSMTDFDLTFRLDFN